MTTTTIVIYMLVFIYLKFSTCLLLFLKILKCVSFYNKYNNNNNMRGILIFFKTSMSEKEGLISRSGGRTGINSKSRKEVIKVALDQSAAKIQSAIVKIGYITAEPR